MSILKKIVKTIAKISPAAKILKASPAGKLLKKHPLVSTGKKLMGTKKKKPTVAPSATTKAPFTK